MKEVIFRADGSGDIGLGHIMRCLTLASALRGSGVGSRFVTRAYSDNILRLIKDAGFKIKAFAPETAMAEDLAETLKSAKNSGADAVICDGYKFDEGYYSGIKASGLRLVVIDDLADKKIPADIVLNQNIYASPEMYEHLVRPETRLLLGTRYCLLRKEFADKRKAFRRTIGDVGEVLITLGGADPENHTLKLIRALEGSGRRLKVTAVLGAANPNIESVREFAADSFNEVEIIVNAGNMAELMARADIGMTAGGTTVWETACMGLPTLILTLADNQKEVASVMGKRGISIFLGQAEEVEIKTVREAFISLASDKPLRSTMMGKNMELVDGKGADRVAEIGRAHV